MSEGRASARRTRTGGSGQTLTEGTLANGASFALWPDPRDTVASCQIWVAAGTADEPAGRSGIAHMLEHMMFRGTRAVPDGAFDLQMERMGVSVNAATWLDYTFYAATGPPDVLPTVLELESDRFTDLAIVDPVFQSERDVVANERRQVVDAVPDARLSEVLHRHALQGTPYANPTIGLADEIAAYSASGVADFYERHYAPGNVCVVICGAIDVDRAIEEIERTFGALRARSVPRRSSSTTIALGSEIEVRLPISSRRLLAAWPAPERGAAGFAAWALLNEVLGQGESSRLPVRLEMEDRSVFDIATSLYALRLPGLLEIDATLRPGVDSESVVGAIDEEIAAIADGGLAVDEIVAARNRLRTSEAADLAETGVRAERLGESWIFFGRADRELRFAEELERVSKRDVECAAASLLDTSARTLAWGLPDVTDGEP